MSNERIDQSPVVRMMEVIIDKVKLDGDVVFVAFSSACGKATASWVGQPPGAGEVHDVELDVDDHFVWGENIFLTDEAQPSIRFEDNVLELVGLFISFDDGCVVMDLGGSVILIDVLAVPNGLVGYIKCVVMDVTLYPTYS